jgi:hypothetical protein
MSEQSEANDAVIERCTNVLTAAQSGGVQGIICVCFLASGAVHVEVAGEQPMLIRLGALHVATDCIKLLETQLAQQRAQQANWGPAGNA